MVLRITVELVPGGRESGKRTIAEAEIMNVSGGATPNYEAVFLEQGGAYNVAASLEDYPRWSAPVWDLIAHLASKALTSGDEKLPVRPEPVNIPVHASGDIGYVRFADIPEPARSAFIWNLEHSTRPLIEEDPDPRGCAYVWDWEDFLAGQR